MEGQNRVTLTVEEAAEMFGCHKNTLYSAIQHGEFKDIVIRIGRRVYISRIALETKLKGS